MSKFSPARLPPQHQPLYLRRFSSRETSSAQTQIADTGALRRKNPEEMLARQLFSVSFACCRALFMQRFILDTITFVRNAAFKLEKGDLQRTRPLIGVLTFKVAHYRLWEMLGGE
jgi:hypothetical protein